MFEPDLLTHNSTDAANREGKRFFFVFPVKLFPGIDKLRNKGCEIALPIPYKTVFVSLLGLSFPISSQRYHLGENSTRGIKSDRCP